MYSNEPQLYFSVVAAEILTEPQSDQRYYLALQLWPGQPKFVHVPHDAVLGFACHSYD